MARTRNAGTRVANASQDLDLAAFWTRNRPALSRLCVRWSRGHLHDADDLLGDASLKVLEALGRMPAAVDNLLAFWATVIVNVARDRLRARARRRHVESRDPSDFENIADPADDFELRLSARSVVLHASLVLPTLSAEQQLALVRRTRGDEYPCIAASLGTTEQNARKLVQVARDSLRALRADSPRARGSRGRTGDPSSPLRASRRRPSPPAA